MIGIRNAPVFPVPVWATPSRSLPMSRASSVLSWISVGLSYPFLASDCFSLVSIGSSLTSRSERNKLPTSSWSAKNPDSLRRDCFFHQEGMIECGGFPARTRIFMVSAVRTLNTCPGWIRVFTLSVVYCCIIHKIDFEQLFIRAAILFKMTNLKEFAALAESEKKRGVPEYGNTAWLKSRLRNFDKENQIFHIPPGDAFPTT